MIVARHFRAARVLRKEPGGDDDETGLCEFGRLQIERTDIDPAMCALDLWSEEQRRHHQYQRQAEDDEARTPRHPGRKERQRHQHAHGQYQIHQLALDEMERVKADALGYWRAGRHADEHAHRHEQEHGKHQSAVHGEPPAREKSAITASEQHGSLLEGHLNTGQLRDDLDEGIAPHFEVRDTGRRRRRPATAAPPRPACRRPASRERGSDRTLQRTAGLHRHGGPECCGELFRGLTDEVGPRQCGKQRAQRLDATCLRDAASDPEDVLEGGQRLFGSIRVGGLEIVDEGNRSGASHLLHAMRKAGEALHCSFYDRHRHTEGMRRAIGHAGILPVVPAPQSGHAAQVDLRFLKSGAPVAQDAIIGGDAIRKSLDDRDLANISSRPSRHVGDRGAPSIIHADSTVSPAPIFANMRAFTAA